MGEYDPSPAWPGWASARIWSGRGPRGAAAAGRRGPARRRPRARRGMHCMLSTSGIQYVLSARGGGGFRIQPPCRQRRQQPTAAASHRSRSRQQQQAAGPVIGHRRAGREEEWKAKLPLSRPWDSPAAASMSMFTNNSAEPPTRSLHQALHPLHLHDDEPPLRSQM
jgi:hypothetical protein